MRPELTGLALALCGCLSFADGRAQLEGARAGRPRYLHELGELGDPRVPAGPSPTPRMDEAIEAIRPWSRADELEVRLTALEALRRLAGRAPSLVRVRYPDLFDAALADPAPVIRWRAAWAIGRLGLARPGLREALRDPAPRVAERAAWALGQAGDDAAVPDLVEALARGEPVAASAEAALTALTGARLGRDPAAWRARMRAR